MAHIGLICPAISGHLNPMTTLGHELHQRGHQVTLVGKLDARAKVLAAGLGFLAIGEADFPLGSTAHLSTELGKLSGLKAFRYIVNWFRQDAITLLEEAPAAIKSSGIEILLIDQTSFGGDIIAEKLDLPFISVCCALTLNRDPYVPPFNTTWTYHPTQWARLRNQAWTQLVDYIAKPIRTLLYEYRQEWNLPSRKRSDEPFSKLAQISQQPPEFAFPRQSLPRCFHFTGPYINPASREPTTFPFEKLTDQPLIYASLGTLQNRLFEIFKVIAETCQNLDAQLVIALGGGSTPESLPALPGKPLVVSYAPQLELLKRSTLTVTHAGINTTLESLSNGVPMVAIPIANDQPGVASRIAWTGTGEFVLLKRLSVANLQPVIQQVLSKESYKNNALRLQTAIQKAGGVKKAADIVEQVISTGKPVLRLST